MSAILVLGIGIAASSSLSLWLQSMENERNEQLFQCAARERGVAMAASPQTGTALPAAAPGVLRIARSNDVAGSRQRSTASTTRLPSGIVGPGPWMILIGGSFASVLLAALLQSLANRAKRREIAGKARQADNEARQSMERMLLDTQTEIRDLAASQDRAIENERKRIAREIHDDLGQNLLALRIDVTLLDQQTTATHPKFNAKVKALLAQVDTTIKSIRAVINHLRPAALDRGLCAALEWQIQQMTERSKVAFTLVVENRERCRALDDEQATAIFRIVQEALSNVVRHANAQHAEIRVWENDGALCLRISDDGVGAYPGNKRKPRSFGLIGIRERVLAMGGEFSITSEPNGGTILSLSVPCRHPEREAGGEPMPNEA